MQPQTATIQCKFINPIKPGGKFGSIKDSTDHLWRCSDPQILAMVQKGQQITISYTKQQWSSGPVDVIEEVLDEAPRTAGTQAPQPSPQHPAQPSYRSKTQEESCEIFINGFLQNCFQGTGQVPPAPMMAHLIYSLRCAWLSAMAKPIMVVKVGEPVIPVPTPERPALSKPMYDHSGIPPQQEDWEAPYSP